MNVNEIVLNALLPLALTVISAVCSYAILCLKKAKLKIEAEIMLIKDQRVKDTLSAALNELDDLAEKTVGALEQTVAKDLRQAVKNGEIDKKRLKSLATKAYTTVCKQMNPEYLDALTEQMADPKEYIKNTIESKVLKVKSLNTVKE